MADHDDTWRSLRERVAEARDRQVRLRRGLEARRGEPAEVGDLLVLPATAQWPVEWLVIRRLRWPPGGARLLVVADLSPLTGPGDLVLPADEIRAPLTIRCRLAARVGGAVVDAGHRVGWIGEPTLTRVHEAHDAWRDEAPPPDPEAEPEYRAWLESAALPAWARLSRPGGFPRRR